MMETAGRRRSASAKSQAWHCLKAHRNKRNDRVECLRLLEGDKIIVTGNFDLPLASIPT